MTEHDIIHERLCAYALGELEGTERARLERELAESAELRGQLAEVERTIGLVRGAFAGEERLSDAALEGLLERAGGARSAPAPRLRLVPLRSLALRAAAAVVMLVGGVLGALAVQRTYFSSAPGVASRSGGDMTLAKLERQRAQEGGEAESAQLLREIGYAQEDAAAGVADNEGVDRLEDLGYAAAPAEESKVTANASASDPGDMFNDSPFDDPSIGQRFAAEAPEMVPLDLVAKDAGDVKIYTWRDTEKDRNETRTGTYRGPGDSVAAGVASRSSVTPEAPAALESGRYQTIDRPAPTDLSALGYGVEIDAPATVAPGADDHGQFSREEVEQLGALGYLGGGGTGGGKVRADADGAVDQWMGREAAEPAPVDRERLYEQEVERLLERCRPLPHEKPSAMYFRFWGDHAFEWTRLDALSTFSVDVDTASYALARDYLRRGYLPEKAAVRTEEFLNYFDADLPAPVEEDFAIHTELAPSLFGGSPDRWMLRVGIRGRDVAPTERKPLVLTFVVDTSGSMEKEDRLELVKHALRLLLAELDARDSVAVVAYSNEARLILPMTSAAQRGLVESAIHQLLPDGSTNAEAGLRMGYELARASLTEGANNRVVFLSDGVANVGQTDQDRINEEISRHRAEGIYLNTIGVGMGNHNDVFLEQLADKGDGVCDYVDTPAAARRAMVDRFTGTFETIASDVKVQVEFDPAQVARYRLLGYENRAIADADFRNDAVDAGEVGAGHQVVALYELERTGATGDGPLATVHLRWKQPKGVRQDPLEADVTEIERSIGFREAAGGFGGTSPGYRRSVLVAQFSEVLRRSTHARGDSYERLVEETRRLENELREPDFVEFRGLVERARDLILAEVGRRTELDRVLDDYRSLQIERALRRELERRESQAELDELLEREAALVARIRELVREQMLDGR